MAGSPARQLTNLDHQQWPPHNAQICPGGAERGIDAATAQNAATRALTMPLRQLSRLLWLDRTA
jgi:hypothetical protein